MRDLSRAMRDPRDILATCDESAACTLRGNGVRAFGMRSYRSSLMLSPTSQFGDSRGHQFFRYLGNLRSRNSSPDSGECFARAFDPWLLPGTIKIPDGSSIGMRLRTILSSYLLFILFKSYTLSLDPLFSSHPPFLPSFLYIEDALFAIWRFHVFYEHHVIHAHVGSLI